MKKSLLIVPVLAVAALCAPACSPKVNDPADVQAVRDTAPAYDKFANASDAAGLASQFYTADGIRMDPNQPASAGTEAIRAALEKSYAQSSESIRNVIDDVRVVGGFAAAKGTFEGTSTPKAGGTAVPVKGKFVTLYEKQADGAWKAVWDIYNSDLPEAGKTADGADEAAITRIEQDWAAAMVKGDDSVLERNLAKEWTLTEDGQTTTREQALGAFKSGAYKVESATLRDLRVFVLGDAAIATMVAETKGTLMGKPVRIMRLRGEHTLSTSRKSSRGHLAVRDSMLVPPVFPLACAVGRGRRCCARPDSGGQQRTVGATIREDPGDVAARASTGDGKARDV